MDAFDVAVVGQGYAGLCAAELARDAGLKVVTFEGVMAAGAVMTVLGLDPSPVAFTSSGPDLGALLAMENMAHGVETVFDTVIALRPDAYGTWRIVTSSMEVLARHVVLATGTRPRTLDVIGELEFTGHGVSRCADCDGWRVQGQDCVVVGAGDAAFQQAGVLADLARSVTILMRGDVPRARPDLVATVMANPLTRLIGRARIHSVEGDAREGVAAVTYDSPSSPTSRLECAGVFVQIGGVAETSLVPVSFERDANGALLVDDDGATDAPGLWAIGAVRSAFPGRLAEAGDDARRAIYALLERDRSIRESLTTTSRNY